MQSLQHHQNAGRNAGAVPVGEVTCDLYAFLTTEANAEVAPIHPKAMPVILTTANEIDVWLNAPNPVALELQRPLAMGDCRSSRGARGPTRHSLAARRALTARIAILRAFRTLGTLEPPILLPSELPQKEEAAHQAADSFG